MITEIVIYIAIGMALCAFFTWVLGEKPNRMFVVAFAICFWPIVLFSMFLIWLAEASRSR